MGLGLWLWVMGYGLGLGARVWGLGLGLGVRVRHRDAAALLAKVLAHIVRRVAVVVAWRAAPVRVVTPPLGVRGVRVVPVNIPMGGRLRSGGV